MDLCSLDSFSYREQRNRRRIIRRRGKREANDATLQVGKLEFDDYNPNSIKLRMNFAVNLSDFGTNKGMF